MTKRSTTKPAPATFESYIVAHGPGDGDVWSVIGVDAGGLEAVLFEGVHEATADAIANMLRTATPVPASPEPAETSTLSAADVLATAKANQ